MMCASQTNTITNERSGTAQILNSYRFKEEQQQVTPL
jgi:hypothetical protein